MNIAGFPLQGVGQMASQITGNESFQNVARDAAQFASTATQPGGLPNAALDAVAGNVDLGQPVEAGLDFLRNILTGQPIDPSAIAQLVGDSGLIDGFSAQQGFAAFDNVSNGNIGDGIQNAADAVGLNLPFMNLIG